MALSLIWAGLFFVAAVAALYQWLWVGSGDVFSLMVDATYEMASLAVEISIGLIGVLCLWMGLFRIAEKAGLIAVFARLLDPFFRRLMPGVPAGHAAQGSVTMNLAANLLGLDNAATPMGLKAMQDLQELNACKETATDAQILFLVLNTSSVTLLPVTIFLYRAQQGSADPTAVFVPILLATSASTLTGLASVAWFQRLHVRDPVVLAYVGGFTLIMAGLLTWLAQLTPEELSATSGLIGNLVLFCVVIAFIGAGAWQRVGVYDRFIEGARQGFDVAVGLIPYLVAMLVAIGVFRASGAMDAAIAMLAAAVSAFGADTGFVDALPTALMKPLSGSGARAMMLETMNAHGVDSFPATLAAIVQGSTETTFYVLAVYFGSVGIRNVRHAVTCGLLADAAGIATAIAVGYWFFG